MRIGASCLATALFLGLAATANATIGGSTYEFSTSQTGETVINPAPGAPTLHTDPANPGFCVGSTFIGPNCANNSGVSGSFAFSTVSPTQDQITLPFSG